MMTELWHMVTTLLGGYSVPSGMIDSRYPQLIQRTGGLLLTLLITATGLIAGFALGVLLVACRRNPLTDPRRDPGERIIGHTLQGIGVAVVEGVRGLPIILLVLLVFSLPYPLTGLRLPTFLLAVVAFGLYAGAYLAESMRAGLRSVDPQLRATGRVLGLNSRQIFAHIELPLVYRTMRPDLVNVAITVFKDTSTLAVVAVPELTYTGRQMLISEPAHYALCLLIVLFLYWAPATAVSVWAARREQHRTRLEGFAISDLRSSTHKGG